MEKLKKTNRERVWERINILDTFTVKDLKRSTKLGERTILERHLAPLIKAGYVTCLNPEVKIANRNYKLIKRSGKFIPDLLVNGQKRPPDSRQRMWLSMKVLKKFEIKDISLTAKCTDGSVRVFIWWLVAAGYLKCRLIKDTQRTLYYLPSDKDTGPIAPVVQRGGIVFDRNIKRIVFKRQRDAVNEC